MYKLLDPTLLKARTTLTASIDRERTGIDAGFWFMEDRRYSTALIEKHRAGVRVRCLVDLRANSGYPMNGRIIDELTAAGIPLRHKTGGGILHWKFMGFHGQATIEFGSANFSPDAWRPEVAVGNPEGRPPNCVAETICFCDEPEIVSSFLTRFDDLWTDARFADLANITPKNRTRVNPPAALSPDVQFVPLTNYGNAIIRAINQETQAIDVTMYRITFAPIVQALLAALGRGVAVRLIVESGESLLDPTYGPRMRPLVNSLIAAGASVRMRKHIGMIHQKSITLRSQGLTVFGSSNWSSASCDFQEEHNLFTRDAGVFAWFVAQFERRWASETETQPVEA
jgi:phosphatidylserine/phosphatidylglycerophosphate/cardiolipin synthase-like enzyme